MDNDNQFFDDLVVSMVELRDWAQGNKELPVTRLERPAPPPDLTPEAIRDIRARSMMSQGLFSTYLGVSTRTLQSWEQGQRRPTTSALRLMQIIQARPDILQEIAAK